MGSSAKPRVPRACGSNPLGCGDTAPWIVVWFDLLGLIVLVQLLWIVLYKYSSSSRAVQPLGLRRATP